MSATGPHERENTRLSWRIRPARVEDAAFLAQLAERLAIGIPPWRDPLAMIMTARGWLLADLERAGQDGAMFIAETDGGVPIGAVAIARSQHFTGAPQADIGELAVVEEWEGLGVATALLNAAEEWARTAGLPFITLATGAANSRALRFYARHGYQHEDVRLTKPLT